MQEGPRACHQQIYSALVLLIMTFIPSYPGKRFSTMYAYYYETLLLLAVHLLQREKKNRFSILYIYFCCSNQKHSLTLAFAKPTVLSSVNESYT